jgi:hypothetical protein
MNGYREVFHRVTKGNRSRLLVVATVMGLVGLYLIPAAQAVHDTGRFQLDGDAATGTNTAGTPTADDDWDKVCHQYAPSGTACGTTSNTTASTAGSWVAEPNHNASIFTGGGSKDPQEISNWAWKNAGGLPDKDNLLHSFGVRYSLPAASTCPSGSTDPTVPCDVLFFGSDRLDNSGDAQQGFWFFQNKITLGSTPLGGGTSFNGVHKNGDVLVISDFSIGGTVSTISVYVWDNTVNGNLRLLETSDAAKCRNALPAGDPFCGIVNPSTIAMPWSFLDKSGTPSNGALNGEFYEGGINLSLLGLSGECFSSVASETRSSTSTTATLKDFILGQFAVCSAGMTTQASATVAAPVLPGTAVHDTATINVTGATSALDPSGTVTFSYCFNATSVPSCPTTGNTSAGTGLLGDENHDGAIDDTTPNDGSAKALSDDVNTVANPLNPGFYCFRADWPGDTTYPGALSTTNTTTECFRVKDTTSISTTQKWLPQDTASVATGSGATAPAGTVVFSLYLNGTCSGAAARTFTDSDGTDGYVTNNTTYETATTTISWSATFTPTVSTNIDGSTTTRCERSDLTVTNNSGPFPPA